MCGIAGFISPEGLSGAREVGNQMAAALAHRGPDSNGLWVSSDNAVCMAHARLAIVDLTETGLQPMTMRNGRYVLTYNGEIYNAHQLKKIIETQHGETSWAGTSDTEILFKSILLLGLEVTLKLAQGMFAFALWDEKTKELTLARDRMGEKPLYYGIMPDGSFLFASELKAIKKHPSFSGRIDRVALRQYLNHGYFPSPSSVYAGVFKLIPASYLVVQGGSLQDRTANRMGSPKLYWSLSDSAELTRNEVALLTESECVNRCEGLLRASVKQQMIADVPLGAFLSGGIDSSLIVATMQNLSSKPVNTFTVGFQEEGYNEAPFAGEVAKALGTDHSELYVSLDDARDVIPQLPQIFDEPFADASQLPTFLISKMARRSVKVILSGDGGDELFGGYDRYYWCNKIWRILKQVPAPMRPWLSNVVAGVAKVPVLDTNFLVRNLAGTGRQINPAGKFARLPYLLSSKTQEELYLRLLSNFESPGSVLKQDKSPDHVVFEGKNWNMFSTIEQNMMYLDTITYLPDDILTKVDRCSMAVSLETRVPFLDHRLQEFGALLPLEFKMRNGQGKWILRELLRKRLPSDLFERPKKGFSVPIASWLKGSLRPWAEDLIHSRAVVDGDLFDASILSKIWHGFVSGRQQNQQSLWTILVFLDWLSNE
ncbi:MAG: asparagine synthase (glutamine-hydrolyzing) [Kordiimonadaceae bacterium]|nr:asparagine synthase (glutamine-hydrolyzing) [Kordiimonadaceae bacterium]MBO6569321.1 asparagine synthase (glutamine-hydrolyzing) [Kordiimonadaceae bacterium]MBO6964797.1 asparagine synthase (glutamine-hydrolyzing) [Kordiimonadaceae bacterium]